jgi:hypothetical protein
VGAILLSSSSASHADPCPIAGQNPMMIIQLFFGQDVAGKGPLPRRDWNAFLRDTVTPRFPDGFTVFDSYGQWRAPGAAKIGRERSRMIEIAAVDSPEVRKNIADLTALYRARFHQQSVGIVTMPGCGAF